MYSDIKYLDSNALIVTKFWGQKWGFDIQICNDVIARDISLIIGGILGCHIITST